MPPSPAAALPVLTFPTRATFHWNGNTVNVYHVANAHTDGDSIIHFTNLNVFHMGDTFVNGGYPFIDNGSNGSINGLIAAAESVLARSDANTKIIPGHGPLANKSDMQRFHDMLVKVRGNLKTLIDQNKTGRRSRRGEADSGVRRGVGHGLHEPGAVHALRLSKPEELAATRAGRWYR